ncbi:MAG: aquaporin [Rhodospirillales bacterium]|nr:aquaporin [Rhodospirillales bacterium]
MTRRGAAEFLGTAFLLAAIVGSALMGEKLAAGNGALALLANALATAAALAVLILIFAPISGAHFNPFVTLAMAYRRDVAWSAAAIYIVAQLAGAMAGVGAAHLMFEAPMFTPSANRRSGGAQMLSEFIATFGLIGVIWIGSRRRPDSLPWAVGAYIGAAYWFTASTSFANPAVTLARALTGSMAGIHAADVPAFIAAQAAGLVAAIGIFSWLAPATASANTGHSSH